MGGGSSINELLEVINQRIEDGEIGIAEASVITKQMNQSVRGMFTNTEESVTREALESGYQHILNGYSKEQAEGVIIDKQDKDEDWWNKVKNKDCFISKDVVMSFDDHPKQKRMVREKTMDKVAVKSSKTANQLLRRVEHCVNMDGHIQDKKQLREEVDDLKKSLEETKRRLSVVEQTPTNTKEIIQYYKQQGMKQREVVELTGYSMRTVKRWWNN